MSRVHLWAALAAVPSLGLGLWLWREAGGAVWLSGFVAACF